MRKKKSDVVVIIFASILLTIVFGIAFISFTTPEPPAVIVPSPTPTPLGFVTRPTTASVITGVPAPVLYTPGSQEKLLGLIENRKPLSISDQQAKQKLISLSENNPNNMMYQSPNIIVDYIPSADIFQVEILSLNVQDAKEEATSWFEQQGVSKEGICTYPVQFYLNYDVVERIRALNATFDPLGIGC